MQKPACHLGGKGVKVYSSKRCTSSRSASYGKRPYPPPKVACGTAALLLPAAVRLFQKKPAAPPPAAGFFVCAPIAMPRDRSRCDWSLLRSKLRASSTGCRRSDERHLSMPQPSFGKRAGIGCILWQKGSPAGTQDRRFGCRHALPRNQGVEEQGKTRRTTFGRVLRR